MITLLFFITPFKAGLLSLVLTLICLIVHANNEGNIEGTDKTINNFFSIALLVSLLLLFTFSIWSIFYYIKI